MSLNFEVLMSKIKRGLGQIFRWLTPGLGVKRWLILILLGITIISIGIGIYLLDLFRNSPDTWWLPVISFLSLKTVSRTLRFVIFGFIGFGLILWGITGVNKTLVIPFLRPGKKLVDQVYDYRRREKGPRIVVIGGGHGISTVLRGLKNYTHNLTAVVSVADDGGSSGELRRTLGILPPGDIRNCLAALSNDEDLLTQLFQYRFSGSAELSGHSFGNLFISAMVDITGSFDDAILESGKVLSVFGKVLPSTLENVHLVADVQLPNIGTEVRVVGESSIPEASGKVRRVWIEPNDAAAFPPAITSLLNADMIVVGPGSIFTSILPNLLVPDILAAFQSSRALKVLVCNIATQKGETDQYTISDHVSALENNIGKSAFELIICNDNYSATPPEGVQWVVLDEEIVGDRRIYCGDLIEKEFPWRHDSTKLSKLLMDLLFERTGPLM
ncbi:uridine diphosphate-N-acetylglucosamine-binding protein YvcK [Chloroflexota bacterium]